MLNEIKVKTKILKNFLDSKGYKVKHVECIEAIPKIESEQCYVAKNNSVRMLELGEKLSFKEMGKWLSWIH